MPQARTLRVGSPVAITSLALLLCACVTAPGNGGEVSATTAPVSFSGVGLAPGRALSVEAASSAAGPFYAVPGATASTSLRPTQSVTISGGVTVPLYGFGLKTVIPARRWHSVAGACPGSETFVRVRDGALSYLTFDTDTAAIACIQSELTLGHSVSQALNSCRSAQSPVLRLTQGATTHVGDVVIDDASDVAALACVETIEGSLTVTSSAPNLVSLPLLHKVTGDVHLTYTSYAPDPHPPSSAYPAIRCGAEHYVTAEVRVFDLPAFTQVDGDLTLLQEGSFSGSASTQAIDLELNALTSVGGDVSITVKQFGGSPCGLTALSTLPGDLTVDFDNGGEVDSSVTGLLSALTEVFGTVTFDGGHNAFGNPLAALHRAGGLHVIKNPSLSGFHFPALTEVIGAVELEGTGPGSAPTGLASVGNLIVHGSGYISLETIGGPALALGGLELHDNAALTMLTNAGVSKITLAPSAALSIASNATLPSPEICSFVAIQTAHGWSGTSTLGGVSCP